MYKDATIEEINSLMQAAWKAYHLYRNIPLKQRAEFLRAIAREIGELGDELLQVTARETNLPEARLRNERARTQFQLNSYADACEKGDWLEARIDTAIPDKNPPKPDIRKMRVPVGPVVVFGAANFPYAYSTAGGDTASALAAGCPVIVKAHPAHPATSDAVAGAILKAVASTGMPEGVFSHIHGVSTAVGRALVEHPLTKSVGFTGSFTGGKQLFDWANQRPEPIPVFAEMSSINPVFLLPGKLNASAEDLATLYTGSITLGVGQFCTNPGLLIGMEGEGLSRFVSALGDAIRKQPPATMLHEGIARNYREKKSMALSQPDVELLAETETAPLEGQGDPVIATVKATDFISNPRLHQEVFGPFSLLVSCRDAEEMLQVARQLEGQLTVTLMATAEEILQFGELVEAVKDKCGRLILNGVPTGVEVCLSMQHGGPFPASTDSRFGSVGADAIGRFTRPLAFQNWPDQLIPEPLRDANPLGIWRTVNNTLTQSPV